jgi:NitT/TauT family transport system permease protein
MAAEGIARVTFPRATAGQGLARIRGGLGMAGMFLGLAVAVAVLWELAKLISGANDQLMPHSWTILGYLGQTNSRGDLVAAQLFHDFSVTAGNAALGFVGGSLLGFATGVLIAKVRIVGAALSPLTILAQSIPIVAIAPALVLWLGTGWETKVVIATYLSFFPLTVATARGFQTVAAEREELFQVIAAGRLFEFVRLGLPSAAPLIFVGLENAASFSVIGAIVAELPFGSTEGLGVAILNAWQFYTIQPSALYCAALASCLLGALAVVLIRIARTLIPAAMSEERTR